MGISVMHGNAGNVSGQAGCMGIGASGVVTTKKPSGLTRIKQNSNSSSRKKELNYNPREISQQILRATRTIGASQALIRARGKVGALERCRATGQYDDNEVRVALAHARRMVNCASKKVNHLKEEERQKKRNEATDEERGQQKANEIKRRVKTKKQQLKRKAEIEMKKLEQAQQMKAREEALEQKRRYNRNKEREEILDADMKYLQGDTGNEMENRTPSYSGYEGVVFEASIQLAGLQAELKQLDDELERAIAQETAAADMAADTMATGGVSEAGNTALAADATAEVPADAGSIDISV